MTVDGAVAMVGTVNLDVRSFALNEQLAVVLDDRALTREFDQGLDEDFAASERVRSAQWRARPRRQRALELAADLAGRPIRGLGSAGLTGRAP